MPQVQGSGAELLGGRSTSSGPESLPVLGTLWGTLEGTGGELGSPRAWGSSRQDACVQPVQEEAPACVGTAWLADACTRRDSLAG